MYTIKIEAGCANLNKLNTHNCHFLPLTQYLYENKLHI